MTPARYLLTETRHGKFLLPPNDTYVGTSLVRYGEYSEPEVDLFRRLLGPGHRVLEVGANLGAHTVPLARIAAEVVAFEPQRNIFQLLCANVALNGLTNIRTYWAGCGRDAGTITVPVLDVNAAQNFGGLELGDAGFDVGDRVPLLRIDDLPDMDCALIKADCEGMEVDVLTGAVDTIARCRPLLYVESDRPHRRPALGQFLQEHHYRAYWYVTPLYVPTNWRGVAENQFSTLHSFNLLCIPTDVQITVHGLEECTDWSGTDAASTDLDLKESA